MTYDEHVEWAKQQFYTLEKKKQQIILELAQRLEKEGMKTDKISEYVSEKLVDAGYVTARYVQKTLPEKYKQKIKVESGKQTGKIEKEAMAIAVTNKGSGELSSPPQDEPIKKRLESIDATPQGGWEEPDEDNEPQDPNQVPDAVFTAKKLAKALDEINVLNVKIDQKDKTIAQLQEVVKKDAFKPASESMNVFQKKNIAIPMAQTELRKLMSGGWHFVNITVEYIS